ncbi:MAG: LPS-assembly protein LptD [Proteobacteria bacterium]|nr:LPS-assembly protein LptD [Pseudomonadota bacterium]
MKLATQKLSPINQSSPLQNKLRRAGSHALSSGIILLALTLNVSAETPDDNALCPAPGASATIYTAPPSFKPENIGNTEISADFTRSSQDGSTSLNGNIVIEQHMLRVTADYADYDKSLGKLSISGNVHIDTESISMDADSGTFDIEGSSKQGEFNNIQFLIPMKDRPGKYQPGEYRKSRPAMKGFAERVHSGDEKFSTLNNAKITSCELIDPDWLISADEIHLDHADEYGSADDVVIRFKGVPFLYTPYIEFPTSDKRRSGLLFPEFGTSSSRGIELAAPWYWNIAPNHDAVITPRIMEKRGTELGGKYRFLTQSTTGELKGAYLNNDKTTDEKRYQVGYKQHSVILPNLQFDADLQDISDPDYFNDFTNSISSTSQTHLNRSAKLRYDLQNWHMSALLQDIKTIDTTAPISDRPYKRLPQLLLNGDTKISSSQLLFTLDSEAVEFAHDDVTRTTGSRINVSPGLSLPLSGVFWFLKPEVKFSHTQYDVGTDGSATVPGGSQQVDDINIPISSINGGLFFERYLDSGYQQTLEPHLYYLYVPYEDQNSNPLFDTTAPTFTISQLFRDNRFIGGDRIGDANQLSLALTSRLLNPKTGDELIRASIGQIFYFEDRKVALSSSTPADTRKQSDVIAELDTTWQRWQTSIDLQWDTTYHKMSRENYFLHYNVDPRHLFSIGYRKRLDGTSIDIEQIDTSFVYGINREYSAFARYNYSLDSRTPIDSIAGIAYDSCCWAIQLFGQRRLQNTGIANSDLYDDSILVQFVFKGLGSLSGSRARTTLEQSIYRYTDILQ